MFELLLFYLKFFFKSSVVRSEPTTRENKYKSKKINNRNLFDQRNQRIKKKQKSLESISELSLALHWCR